jgi:hypothetical protein
VTSFDYALLIALSIGAVVFVPILWAYAKANGIQRDRAFRHMQGSWRRTWHRLGRLEARDRARKRAKR